MAASVWRARWLVLAAVLVAGVGGYFLSSRQDPTYFAQSRIVLAAAQAFDPLGRQTFGDPTRFIADQAAIIGTQPVLERAAAELDGGVTVGDLARGLDVAANGDNDVITVGMSAPTSEDAADRANAVVEAYRSYVADAVAAEAAAATAATGDPAVVDQIATEAAIYSDGVAIVEPAFPPGDPATPVPLRDAALLAAIAALLAVGVALIRRPERSGGTDDPGPLLGAVTVAPGREVADLAGHSHALVALDYARGDAAGRPVLITGTSASGPAPAVAHGLAAAAAAQGQRVLLVDAQPGRRELSQRLGGIRPHRTLDSLGQTTESESDVLTALPVGGAPSAFAVLGQLEEAPVRADAVRLALSRLTRDFDLVIIQTGSLADSSLAYALVRESGPVVAAVDADDDPGRLQVLRAQLATASRELDGVVRARAGRTARRSGGEQAGVDARPASAQPSSPAPLYTGRTG
ncbi:hypothetical protein ACI78R_17980 [Geodermatophilus sp. SYSU D01106]